MDMLYGKGIICSVANEEVWGCFSEVGTEMILTKTGRNLYPKLQYKVEGLEPGCEYYMFIRFELVDNKKYKYKNGGWTATECCDPAGPALYDLHPDGLRRGEEWMKNGVSFDRVKITNNVENSRSSIVLQSMRKYVPVFSIFLSNKQSSYANDMVKIFDYSTPLQEFIAVTAYQNARVTKLKIENNPYAKGFREGPKNRKRSLSSIGTTPSPNVSVAPYVRNDYGVVQNYCYNEYPSTSSQGLYQPYQPMYQPLDEQYLPACSSSFSQPEPGPSGTSEFYQPPINYSYQDSWCPEPPNKRYLLNPFQGYQNE